VKIRDICVCLKTCSRQTRLYINYRHLYGTDKQYQHVISEQIKLCPSGATNLRAAVAKHGKVFLDPHLESDQHQNRIPSSSSPPAPTYQVWSRFVNPFRSYPADRYTDRHRYTHNGRHNTCSATRAGN